MLEEEDSGGWWRWRGGFKIFLGHNVLTGAYYDMCGTNRTLVLDGSDTTESDQRALVPLVQFCENQYRLLTAAT